MKEEVAAGVEGGFVAEVVKNLGVGSLNIDAALVLDHTTRPEVSRPLAANMTVEQEPRFRQRGLGAGKNLDQAERAGPEEQRVPPPQ